MSLNIISLVINNSDMKICIIGGSTSGWWSAGYFEKHFEFRNNNL